MEIIKYKKIIMEKEVKSIYMNGIRNKDNTLKRIFCQKIEFGC